MTPPVDAIPEIGFITEVGGYIDGDGRQWITWSGDPTEDGGLGIALPHIEFTPQRGDRVTFYWAATSRRIRYIPQMGVRPLGVRINNGPYIPYPND